MKENTKGADVKDLAPTSINAAHVDLGLTVDDMISVDHDRRFRAEYWQLKIRLARLKAFIARIEAADRTQNHAPITVPMPRHSCPLSLLLELSLEMEQYLHLLEVRAVIEGVELDM